ncbi:hypothetical protein CCR75_009689 [Bremia lactucae]|uniref:Uncharacterized protein n=1 Tax=Bremia lactucae TaxID=4779 RepID=A0A976FQW9_BRELC|nr:hypothetical protein CCR75_009689 [Bremia lactucae]
MTIQRDLITDMFEGQSLKSSALGADANVLLLEHALLYMRPPLKAIYEYKCRACCIAQLADLTLLSPDLTEAGSRTAVSCKHAHLLLYLSLENNNATKEKVHDGDVMSQRRKPSLLRIRSIIIATIGPLFKEVVLVRATSRNCSCVGWLEEGWRLYGLGVQMKS